MKHLQYIPAQTGKNAGLALMSAAITSGVVIGSIPAIKQAGETSPWLHQYFSPILCGDTVFSVFGKTLLSEIIFLTAVFLLGTFAFGQAAGGIMLIYRGIGIGVSVSQMYTVGGLRSLPAVAALALPYSLAVSLVAILAVRESMRSSNRILFYFATGKSVGSERRGLKMYCIRFAVLMIISLFISAADSLLNYIFAGLL